MNDHIDQLKEWWENAEDAPANPGDHIIERHVCERDEDTYYTVGVHREGMSGLIGKSGTRILRRAPRPKPAWHDAPALIAWTALAERQVWERGGGGTYYGTAGDVADDYELHDVTPLIEAKVTDEVIDRILDVIDARRRRRGPDDLRRHHRPRGSTARLRHPPGR